MGEPRVPPLNPSETIVLWVHNCNFDTILIQVLKMSNQNLVSISPIVWKLFMLFGTVWISEIFGSSYEIFQILMVSSNRSIRVYFILMLKFNFLFMKIDFKWKNDFLIILLVFLIESERSHYNISETILIYLKHLFLDLWKLILMWKYWKYESILWQFFKFKYLHYKIY